MELGPVRMSLGNGGWESWEGWALQGTGVGTHFKALFQFKEITNLFKANEWNQRSLSPRRHQEGSE